MPPIKASFGKVTDILPGNSADQPLPLGASGSSSNGTAVEFCDDVLECVPKDRIRKALLLGARAGVFGSVRIEVSLTPEAVEHFDVVTVTDFSSIPGKPHAAEGPPDEERELSVEKALHGLAYNALRRETLMSLTGHFSDGRLIRFNAEHRS